MKFKDSCVPLPNGGGLNYICCPCKKNMEEAIKFLYSIGWKWSNTNGINSFDPYKILCERDDSGIYLFLESGTGITYCFMKHRLMEIKGWKKIEVIWDEVSVNKGPAFCSCPNPVKKKSTTSLSGGGTEFFICMICKKEV